MKVSIQGIKGAFHEEAARLHFSNEISIVENLTFEQVVESVENGESDAGIMAIENTISGTIHANFELIKKSNLKIVGEVHLRIEQHLAVLKGVKLEELTQVESHYMAINQCRTFFQNHPKIKLVDIEDTALSMKNIAENELTTTGGIGSEVAAKEYGLEIIGNSIQTNKRNYTRFLILQKEGNDIEETNKATIQLILNYKKGSLLKVLSVVNSNNVDLSKIESLPIADEPWHYQFYLDVNYENLEDYGRMLKGIQPHIESMKVLGNYINENEVE